jgi:hypothetical protein
VLLNTSMTATKNSIKRTFRRAKQNAREQTARAGCSLPAMLAALALGFLAPRVATGALENLVVGENYVIGDSQNPQDIYLNVYNSGSQIAVGSLNFVIQLGDGTGTTPSISNVDLKTGTIFSSGLQGAQPGTGEQIGFYGVVTSPAVDIPQGWSRLATISFVTAGTASGRFDLSLSALDDQGQRVGTDYFTEQYTPVGLTFSPGYLNVTPVPEPVRAALPLFGGFVALAGGYGWWYRRKANV